MTWAKVDDRLWCHPKFLDLSLEATGVWVRSLSWCSMHLTDGAIPRALPATLGWPTSAVDQLVAAVLWDEADRGWAIHDYLEFNPSKAEVLAERSAGKKRASRSRDRRKRTDVGQGESVRPNEQRTFAVRNAPPDPVNSSLLSTTENSEAAVAVLARDRASATAPEPVLQDRTAEVIALPQLSRLGRAAVSADPGRIHAVKASNRLAMAFARTYPVDGKWRPSLELIGARSDAEWDAAIAALRSDVDGGYPLRNLTPRHLADYWDSHYAHGASPGECKPPVKRFGSAPVSSAADFAADRAGGNSPW